MVNIIISYLKYFYLRFLKRHPIQNCLFLKQKLAQKSFLFDSSVIFCCISAVQQLFFLNDIMSVEFWARCNTVSYCSIHSWARPPPVWPRLCPVGAVSAKLLRSSCLSIYRSWKLWDSVRNCSENMKRAITRAAHDAHFQFMISFWPFQTSLQSFKPRSVTVLNL